MGVIKGVKMKNSEGEIYPLTPVKHGNLPLANLLLKGLEPLQPKISRKNERVELVAAVLALVLVAAPRKASRPVVR
eukprot:XP_001704697.1 Hypothetical protein GL50803_11143 [Giardia lamblia ATCC 50803]